MDHVDRADLEVDRLVLWHVQLGGLQRCAPGYRGRILVGPGELLAGDFDDHLWPGGLLFVVVEHHERVGHQPEQDHRGDRRPDHLQARVAVDRRSVLQLLAGLHAKVPDREKDHRHDEHEDRHRGDHQHVVERVGFVGLLGGLDREPVDRVAQGDPDRRGHERRDDRPRDRAPKEHPGRLLWRAPRACLG